MKSSLDNADFSLTAVSSLPMTAATFASPISVNVALVENNQLSHCDRAVDLKNQSRSPLTSQERPQSSDASPVPGQFDVELTMDDDLDEPHRVISIAQFSQSPIENNLRRRINSVDSGQSKCSFRSLLGDRQRRQIKPRSQAPEILVGAIVGDSDLIMSPDVSIDLSSTSISIPRSVVKQRMRKVAYLVKDLVRCITMLVQPLRVFAMKSDDVILVRSKGRLT